MTEIGGGNSKVRLFAIIEHLGRGTQDIEPLVDYETNNLVNSLRIIILHFNKQFSLEIIQTAHLTDQIKAGA